MESAPPSRACSFVQIGVLDAGNFKGAAEVENLKRHIDAGNQRYVDYMRSRGFQAQAFSAVGHDVVEKAVDIAPDILARLAACLIDYAESGACCRR